MLKERLRGKRIRLADAEGALLARKAGAVGRKAPLELDTIVSPDSLAPAAGDAKVRLQHASWAKSPARLCAISFNAQEGTLPFPVIK